MASRTLYPVTIDYYQPAFEAGNGNGCVVKFKLSKFNGSQDFSSVQATVRKQGSGLSAVKKTGLAETGVILDIPCDNDKTKDENGYYQITIKDEWIKTLSSNSEEYPGFVPGYSYKIQLRLSEKTYGEGNSLTQYQWLNDNANTFSEWSTVSIVRAIPEVCIQVPSFNQYDSTEEDKDNNKKDTVYVDNLNFNGSYSCCVDNNKSTTEDLYSYQVDIYEYADNKVGDLLDSSGTILSPMVMDESGNLALTQKLIYNTKVDYINNRPYVIRLTCLTRNYYTWTHDFLVFYTQVLNSRVPIRVLTVDNDVILGYGKDKDEHTHNPQEMKTRYVVGSVSSLMKEEEQARIALCLYNENNEALSTNVVVRRSSSKDNYLTWEDIKIFNFVNDSIISPNHGSRVEDYIFYDYAIESGVYYRYCTQTENEFGARSAMYDWVDFKPVARFFDATHILGEGGKQLKLKFDNVVTSLKQNHSETKTDTLGNKYPVFARNGLVDYATMAIGGLVSIQMDDDNLFTDAEDLYKYKDPISRMEGVEGRYGDSQYSYNYEKDFRKKVLEFLNDGKPKLYKSPTEGNMIVRLMDVNFTPNQQLGRLVGSFTANAHELDDFTFENCVKYGISEVGIMVKDFAESTSKLGQLTGEIYTKGYIDYLSAFNSVEYNIITATAAAKDYKKSIEDMKKAAEQKVIDGIYSYTERDAEIAKLNADPTYVAILNAEANPQAGTNLIPAIFDKYNFKGQNIAGKTYTTTSISCVTVTINHQRLSTPLGIRGFVLRYNDQDIYVTNSDCSYTFDNDISFTENDSLYLLTDTESDGSHTLSSADISVDFIYNLEVDNYIGKQIRTKTQQRGIGQLHDYFKPNASLFAVIYNRYYFDCEDAKMPSNNPDFRRLSSLYGIKIEANPGSVFTLRPDQQEAETFEVGLTGVLNFYNLVDFSKITYLGWRDENGNIIDKGTDIVLDYHYYTVYGKYQEED